MKKLLFIAAVAALALTSCQQEKDINGGSVAGANEIGFSLQGAATRSAEMGSPVKKGTTILLGKTDGFELSLEETIADMYYSAPETRGAPVYTENVGYLYKDQLGVFAQSGTSTGVDATYSHLDGPTADGWIYQHRYSENIWPDEDTDVQFYLRMPTDMTDHGVTSVNNAGGTTTVSYTSPTMAKDQEDIIFSGVEMNHKTYMGYYSTLGGAPVTLYHALTGIKFAIKNTDAELAKIQITKISFKGLKNTGSFTFDATDPSRDGFVWDASAATDNVIYQTFEEDDLITYDATTHAGNNFSSTFFAAGTANNLNKADASYTFWLIPQATTSSAAVLRIDYTISDVPEYIEIKVNQLTTSDWQPGQLRTYTFKINDVNLMIDDEMDIQGDANDGYEGSVKSDVTITNTGNTRAFIRAALVGQWLDHNDDPVFGFTDAVKELHLVASWYEDQFGENPQYEQGEFVGLPGYHGATNPISGNDWVLCEDGFYYFRTAVEPGDTTDDLFDTYTVGTIPNAELAGAVIDNASMHFTLEIATQAIAANKLDGTPDTWQNAWARALGTAPTIKQ